MEDNLIVDLYWHRQEAAISETHKKYGGYCFSIASHVLPDKEDARECVSDGNGWNVTALPGRTDAVLLTVPVLKQKDYSQDCLLLDLNTLETENLLDRINLDDILVYSVWFSENLHYAIVYGYDGAAARFWLCDLEKNTIATLDALTKHNVSGGPYYYAPYFLDGETLLFRAWRKNGSFDQMRCHIPTGHLLCLEENISAGAYDSVQQNGWFSRYGLRTLDTGEYELINLYTNERLRLSGISGNRIKTSESPDGRRVMISVYDDGGFVQLGMLDPETGMLKLLSRDAENSSEYFWGWVDNETLALTARDDSGRYFAYLYRFRERPSEDTEPTLPPETLPEPAEDALVRVMDYIPGIRQEFVYASEYNFTGQVIYDFTDAYLRYGTVKKLAKVCQELEQQGLGIKIWDGFRPQKAQEKLWEVCPDPRYVSHSVTGGRERCRGSAVDMTLINLETGEELVMPSGFDDFSALANRDYADCSPEAAENARLLEEIMKQYGFKPYFGEWWHFSDTEIYPLEPTFSP